MIEEIISEIVAGSNFLITAHMRLDGDALGSELALYLMLKRLGKKVTIYNADETPEQYRFLPGAGQIVCSLDHLEDYDIGFILDCSELERLGKISSEIAKIKTLINIDHHVSNNGFSRLKLLDTAASSTGELIYRLMRKMQIELTPDICTNLYAAILTDTGGFRYSNTRQETLHAAAKLVAGGANPQWISENIYENYPLAKLLLLSRVLETLSLDLELKTASLTVSQQHLREADATLEHTDNFVDIPRGVKGIDISILFTQIADRQYKLSLRSKGKVNVEKIARKFGGGGHLNASACRIDGDIDEVKARTLAAVREL